MDRDTALVLNGFISLTPAQRDEFVEVVNSWINGTGGERTRVAASVRESILRVDVGPTSATCGCCGR
jgi:hypothetical protein